MSFLPSLLALFSLEIIKKVDDGSGNLICLKMKYQHRDFHSLALVLSRTYIIYLLLLFSSLSLTLLAIWMNENCFLYTFNFHKWNECRWMEKIFKTSREIFLLYSTCTCYLDKKLIIVDWWGNSFYSFIVTAKKGMTKKYISINLSYFHFHTKSHQNHSLVTFTQKMR